MDVREILEAFRSGKMSAEDAERSLRLDYVSAIGSDAMFDMSREKRTNIPEVIYARSKTPEVTAKIVSSVSKRPLIISRATRAHFEAVSEIVEDAVFREEASIIIVGDLPDKKYGTIGIVTAGTSDIPIAEEARIMASAMGVASISFYDIGVAGMHRIIDPVKEMISSDVDAVIVVAGMEGALPTLVSSLMPVPVIGVPASTGYGAGGSGEAALLAMLQSCSPGLSVVNIDNGIGAGAFAALISMRHFRSPPL